MSMTRLQPVKEYNPALSGIAMLTRKHEDSLAWCMHSIVFQPCAFLGQS